MTKDNAIKLALEALELAQDNLRDHGDNCFLHDEGEYNRCFCGKDSLSNHLQSVVEKLDEALAEQPAQQEQEPVALREALREALAAALTSVYVCGRVWSAWHIGTMTEDDFSPASECDWLLDEIVHAVATAAPQPAQRKPLTDDQILKIGRELGLKCRLGGNPSIDFDYARAIEAAHDIKKENT